MLIFFRCLILYFLRYAFSIVMIVVITLLFSLVFLVFSVFTLLIFILRFREGLQTLGVFDQVTEV